MLHFPMASVWLHYAFKTLHCIIWPWITFPFHSDMIGSFTVGAIHSLYSGLQTKLSPSGRKLLHRFSYHTFHFQIAFFVSFKKIDRIVSTKSLFSSFSSVFSPHLNEFVFIGRNLSCAVKCAFTSEGSDVVVVANPSGITRMFFDLKIGSEPNLGWDLNLLAKSVR